MVAGTSNRSLRWLVESLRLTAFTPDVPKAGQWQEIVGEPPETSTTHARQGTIEEIGPFEGGQLVLSCQPQRADWVHARERARADDYTVLEDLPTALSKFHRVPKAWLGTNPRITRLAFGAVLVTPAQTREAGYRALAPYLRSLEIDPEGSSDLLYQINRARDSKTIRGLKLNRLSRWMVAIQQHVQLQARQQEATVATVVAQSFACRLELDVSTDAQRGGPLPAAEVTKCWSELCSLASGIADEGDVP